MPSVQPMYRQTSLLIGIIAIFLLACRHESIHMDEFENPVYVHGWRASWMGAIIAIPDLRSDLSEPFNLFTI